jgi:hypothetical protein
MMDESARVAGSEPESDAPIGWVAFEVSPELRSRAEEIIEKIRSESDKRPHVPELIDVVMAMTDRGLHYYFLHPLEEAGVGIMTRKAVKLAIGTAGRTLPVVVRKTVGSLNDQQLLSIADFIDHILIREDAEEGQES